MQEAIEVLSWPELSLPHGLLADTRIAPNALVRSAAFSTLEYAGGAQRPEIAAEPLSLAAIKPYVIVQVAGLRLSQSDADLFFWLLSRVYRGGAPKGDAPAFFKRAEALAALGRKRGGKTDLLLEDSLQRLSGAVFAYEIPGTVGRTKLLSCVERFDGGENPYDYKVTVAGDVAPLLDDSEWLVLNGKIREQLASDPLARGLYAFYASHQSAFPMLPDTLKGLMGRESMQDSKWRNALVNALAKVRSATGWVQCELVSAGPLTGKIVVQKGIHRRRGRATSSKVLKPVHNETESCSPPVRAESQ
ncbi:plasmid replication initiator TrfA [Cupriavidus sp. 2KB_3]|uniref:plasmid replication initiator TrfA n=1 Tax=Cupriavidus sp. 2KB_3 TaxID=3232980 RepID=UPI003F918997